jgi:elongation factor Ts
MPAITASMVAELRAKTDAPMMECKKALTEADGDMAAPKRSCASSSATRPARPPPASPPKAWSPPRVDGSTGALVEVNCETDFVSRTSPSWPSQGLRRAGGAAATRPTWPRCRRCRCQDGFGPTVEDVRKGLIGKIGENMSIRRFKRYAGGGQLASYLHGTRIGVIVEFTGDEVAAKDVAMHVAAMKPKALSSADVPAELIESSAASPPRRPPKKAAVAAGKPAQSPRSWPRWSRARCRSS